ncbi:serine hydrolase domain-containing protein [Streptomyces sp. NPDC006197]|uniref:serine hydrolase domain-containing protein n=1 Tax=Streptomyces sp. NPDC006197 TaxID=3156685 RepID=UPI0033B26214
MDAQQIADQLRKLTKKNAVPGAQLAYSGSRGDMSVAVGVLRHGRREPVDERTAFPFGSVTKAFTATLVAQLASDDEVDLDRPLEEILPEWRGPKDGAKSLTARHLLTHTGGLIGEHHPADSSSPSLFRYATSLSSVPPLHAPGTRFSYSNAGYCVLGRLVEEVAGGTWQEVLQGFLLRPLGISPHFLHGAGPDDRPRAHGHAVRPGRGVPLPVEQTLPPAWAPAGGLGGSAEDLIAFCRLHLGRHPTASRLLADEDRAAMHAPYPAAEPFGMADGWAHGLALYGSPDGGWLGHDGTVDGTACHVRFNPRSGEAVALTANATSGTGLWFDVVAELRACGVDVGDYRLPVPSGESTTADPGLLASLVGDYANGDTLFTVRPHGDGLRLGDRTGLVADVVLHDDLVFTAERVDTVAPPYPGRFLPDHDTGDIGLMQLTGRTAKRVSTAG